jgi:hypothetical protein
MPRNGDGSGDSGPIDGHEIVHGASGDVSVVISQGEKAEQRGLICRQKSLKHTQHVAPMPKPEAGDGTLIVTNFSDFI